MVMTAQLGGTFRISRLAVPAICFLIAFLGYSSQLLLRYLEPGPLSCKETIKFNIIVGFIWICYYRACMTDPRGLSRLDERRADRGPGDSATPKEGRWCRKCDAYKPPRAHHCKDCGRYVGERYSLFSNSTDYDSIRINC